MKICFVVSEISLPFINNHTGGGGVFYTTLAANLHNSGHEVFICNFPDNNIDRDKIHKNFTGIQIGNFNVYHFLNEDYIQINYCYYNGEKHSAREGVDIANYVSNFCKDNAIEIIECQDFYGLSQFIDIDIPVLLRLHTNITVISQLKGCESWVTDDIKAAENLSLIMADSVVGVSQFIVEDTRRYCELYDNNIHGVIYNAIEYNKFEYSDYAGVIGKKLIYVGSLNNKKGIDRLLQLFSHINILDSSIELVLVGKGSLASFEQHLLPDASLKIKHIEHVSHEEVSGLIKSCSLFIIGSYHESFGLVVGEAMSLGRAVFIYSECPVFDEVVTDGVNGIIWKDTTNIIGAAQEVVKLINDKSKMSEMGKNGRSAIQKKFGMGRLVSETEKWYKHSKDNLSEIRKNNNYSQKNFIRGLLAERVNTQVPIEESKTILINYNLPVTQQCKQFIKQVLNQRGICRKNLVSFLTLKKIVRYFIKIIPKNKF